MADLDGTTAVVTGASSGIGAATARALAAQGAKLLLACRSESRAAPVLDELSAAGTPALGVVPIDLGDLDSVRGAADTIAERLPRFDVLVDDAGLSGTRGGLTPAASSRVRHQPRRPLPLTTRLLYALGDGAPRRVVTVASKSHYQAKGIDFDAVRRPTPLDDRASRVRGVKTGQRAVPPGARPTCRRARHPHVRPAPRSGRPGHLAQRPSAPALRHDPLHEVAGGWTRTSVYCANSPDVADDTGRYYTDCAVKEPNAAATPELAAELWRRSEEWVAV